MRGSVASLATLSCSLISSRSYSPKIFPNLASTISAISQKIPTPSLKFKKNSRTPSTTNYNSLHKTLSKFLLLSQTMPSKMSPSNKWLITSSKKSTGLLKGSLRTSKLTRSDLALNYSYLRKKKKPSSLNLLELLQ